ncbi:MAG: glycosyl transferase [Lachnospiraceae bacterium]|nr:glycosyl transferase [Lachnospiraceae bacterium]
MIFVVLGTQKFQFDRLLKKIDELIERNEITEKVVAQIGNSDYEPKNYEYYKLMDKEMFNKYIEECDVLVCHGGVGTILSALAMHKKIVACPRLKKYKEHVDDHQKDITTAFEQKNYIFSCENLKKLGSNIKEAKMHDFDEYKTSHTQLVGFLNDYLAHEVEAR